MRLKAPDPVGRTVDLDLALGDQATTSDVDVVPASARKVQTREAGSVDAFVDVEAGGGQAVEGGLVDGRDALGEMDIQCELDGKRERFAPDVGFLGWGPDSCRKNKKH